MLNRKVQQRLAAAVLVIAMVGQLFGVAFADGTNTEGYLVLGADLSDSQRQTVLKFLNVDNIDDYTVSYTTNEQEHEAFDSYLSSSVVGSKALSSILMIPQKKGSGISVSSYNITYCTVEMYQNALISAGVEDVALYIAAPAPVSGTCALVSAMNAYETMTGEEIEEATTDAAVDEIVTTGELGESIGDNDTAAELIAVLKQQMLEYNMSEADLREAVDTACAQMGISVDDDMKQQIVDLLEKLKNTDIDVDALAEQASGMYNKVKDTMQELGITKKEAIGLLQKFLQWLSNLLGKFA